jgi:hypothetical protein
MLKERPSFDSRFIMRPLVCLAAGAVAISTSPVHAQSVRGAAAMSAASTAAVGTVRSSTASTAAPPPLSKDDGDALKTAGYIAGGVGIAGFILFVVAGIGAKNAHDRLDEDCHAGPCTDASHDSDIADGKLFQTAANIGLATGLTGLGLGATLIVLGNRSASDAVPAAGTSAQGGMVTFAGRF